jgi:glycosyltransferase involved in cell wall biosynthesis
MNILFVVPWDNIGGVSHVVNRVARHMRAQGNGVFFLLPGRVDRVERGHSREGFPAFRLPLRLPWYSGSPIRSRVAFAVKLPGTLFRLLRIVRRHKIDVVNIHYPGGHFLYFSLLRRLGLVRLMTSIHGADLLPNGTRRLSHEREVLGLLDASDVIVSPSNSYSQAVREAWPELSRSARTIPNGVDPDELGYDPDTPDETVTPPVIFSILQMVHYKGVDVLIRAFAGLASRYPKVTLRLVSGGPQHAEFEALAESLGVGHRVKFLGFQERDVISRELRQCSIFVLPSRTNSESFGIAAAEAMALDRAVVASHIGGLPELIEEGVSGLLVPPGDVDALEQALRRLLDDESLRQRLGHAAGKRVRQQFLWQRTCALYQDLFDELAPKAELADTHSGSTVPAQQATYRAPSVSRAETPVDGGSTLTHSGKSQEGW